MLPLLSESRQVAACVHVLNGVISTYEWEGKVVRLLRAVAPHIARWNHEPAGERGHGAAATNQDCRTPQTGDSSMSSLTSKPLMQSAGYVGTTGHKSPVLHPKNYIFARTGRKRPILAVVARSCSKSSLIKCGAQSVYVL